MTTTDAGTVCFGHGGNFILLPFRESIRAGIFGCAWSDSELAVLPVLIAHENRRTRIARPSLDRIAVLAGVAKRTAAAACLELSRDGWLSRRYISITGGRTRYEYTMEYAPWRERPDPKLWVRLDSTLIFNGMWAAMPPSVRKLYLVLRAFSWSEVMAWTTDDSGGQDWIDAHDFADRSQRFVDARYLIPKDLTFTAGLADRTARRAWAWLVDHGFIVANEEGTTSSPTDLYREGIIMPDVIHLKCDEVLRRLSDGEEIPPPAPGARSRITSTRKRQKKARNDKASPQSGHSPSKKRPFILKKADTREPEQVFEQAFEQVFEQGTPQPAVVAAHLLGGDSHED